MHKLQSLEPEWLGEIPTNDPEDPRPFLLPGVRVRFAPIGRKAVRAARDAVRASLGLDPRDVLAAADALSEELIRRGIVEWEGIGDAAGDVVAPTQDVPVVDALGEAALDEAGRPQVIGGTISLFLADIDRFEAADRVYVQPWSQRDREKNVSAGSPNGISEQATPALNIALSAAETDRVAGAGPTPKRARKGVPTVSTSRSLKKAKPSGR